MTLSLAKTNAESLSLITIERYTMPGHGSVNSYVLVGENSMALIDTQRTLVEARELLAKLKQIGKPLDKIVLTHEHPDHIGGLALIAEHYPNTPIYAAQITIDYIAREKKPLINLMKGFFDKEFVNDIPTPTNLLVHGETINLAGSDWVIDQLGEGEASSMAMLYSKERDMLFCADTVGHHMTPWVGDMHLDSWLAQLKDLQQRYAHVKTVYPGHGEKGSPADLFGKQLEYLEFFRDLVARETNNGKTVDAAAKQSIKDATEKRYPRSDYPGVAGFPFLSDWNIEALAAELSKTPWIIYKAKVPGRDY